MTGTSDGLVLVRCEACEDVGVIGAEVEDMALCFGSGDAAHDGTKMEAVTPPITIGSLWYEDRRVLERAPWKPDGRHRQRWPRETGRIVKVVGFQPGKARAVVQRVGGRWFAADVLGSTTTTLMERFGRDRGWMALPAEHHSAVTFVEGFGKDPW